MVLNINSLIPSGFSTKLADEEKQREYENNQYYISCEAVNKAQNVLNSNAPFIPSNLFEKYEIILGLCRMQLMIFQRRWDKFSIGTQEEKESLRIEDYERTDDINKEFKELNEDIRNYLSKLDVLD